MRSILSVILAVLISSSIFAQTNLFPGPVGIGTTNPQQKLVVSNNDAEGLEVYLNQPAGVVGLQSYNRTSNAYSNMQFDAGQFSFMYGKVGIGTTNPSEKLELTGSGYFNAENKGVIVDAGGFKRVGFMKYAGHEAGIWRTIGQKFEIGRTNVSSLADVPNSFTTDLFVGGDGNVGIGTTSPSTNWGRVLQVYDYNNAALSVKTAVADWQLVTDASGALQFRDISGGGNAGRMFLASNGNVGIGTTNVNDNTYALYVERGVRTRKVKVDQTTWSDYVFNDDYLLMPLKSLDDYIHKNRHLPDVPSAKEVEKNGLDLGDNQAVLLRKIEELTLYIIDQQKQLDELRSQVSEFKNGKK